MVSVRAARSQVLSAAVVVLLAWCALGSASAQSSKAGSRRPPDVKDPTEEALSDDDDDDDESDGATHGPVVTQAPPIPKAAPVSPAALMGALPFTFSFRGTLAITLYAQSVPSYAGNGLFALTAPAPDLGDGWLMGADLRQSRFAFNVSGPPILEAATLASIEFEMGGGSQIDSIGTRPATLPVVNGAGMPIGAAVTSLRSTPAGDESILPRLRVAYIELNWGGGTNVLRAGQYHNLLLAMISASGAHPAVLGYGAGQLGWRAPGITYSHRFTLSDSVKLDMAFQLNRNSWIDNADFCTAGAPPAVNCLPTGVSLGEAGLPQVQARFMLLGPLAETPWPHYAPTLWQLYVVGHWDQKDLSGVGPNRSMLRDSMTTAIVEAGGKVKLGPLVIATNGWIGQNAGQVFGHIFQMQAPDKPDIFGMGIWGQVGFSLTKKWSLWGFAGIDQPNRADVLAAFAAPALRNVQMAGQLAYVDGPLMATLEWYYFATTSLAFNTTTMMPYDQTLSAYQPSMTFAYAF